jgi:hypothetical protein
VRKWIAQKTVQASTMKKTIVKSGSASAFISNPPTREARYSPFRRQDSNVQPPRGRREDEERRPYVLSALIFGSATLKAAEREIEREA